MKTPVKIPTEKRCARCHQVKPSASFWISRERRDGLDKYCKDCKRIIGAAYAALPAPPEKMCGKCKRILPMDSFCRSAFQKFGRHSTCKDCRNLHRRQNIKSFRDAHRRRKIRKVYGLDYSVYLEILEKQNNVCAICGEPETSIYKGTIKSLAVDHCHSTNRVRGLLCSKCNAGIGYFRDRTDLMQKAITYLLTEVPTSSGACPQSVTAPVGE